MRSLAERIDEILKPLPGEILLNRCDKSFLDWSRGYQVESLSIDWNLL